MVEVKSATDHTEVMIEVVLRAWAENAAAFAEVLADQDPAWGSVSYELAGGWVVLCGPGMFVNRALGVGIGRPLTDAEFDEFTARCADVGVAPAIGPGFAGVSLQGRF
jgi:hypothetical protein